MSKSAKRGAKSKECACKKKHPCKGCDFCQWCSDSRCHVCRSGDSKYAGMSFEDQIAIYEKINRGS